jgi:hypothetical protein
MHVDVAPEHVCKSIVAREKIASIAFMKPCMFRVLPKMSFGSASWRIRVASFEADGRSSVEWFSVSAGIVSKGSASIG